MLNMDEELRKIIEASMMQGSMSASAPDEGMDLAAIRKAGAGMTPSGGEDLPRGTKVNFTEPDLEVSAPQRQVITPRASAEKVVQVPGSPAAPDDMELALARHQDRMARSGDAFERGSRQLVAGLTRTPVQDAVGRPSDAVAALLASRKAQDATHNQNEQQRLGAAKFNFDQSEAARKAAEASAETGYRRTTDADAAKLAREQFDETKRHNLGTEANGRISALKPSGMGGGPAERDENGNLVPKTYKDQLRANGVALRPDEYLVDPKSPGFRDAAQAAGADKMRGNLAKLEAHRADAAKFLAEYHAAGSDVLKQDNALGRLGVALGAAASMVRTAENMGDSVQAQQAADQMLSLSHGDPKNLKNFVNEGRIDSLLEASVGAAHHNVVNQMKHMNVGIREGGGAKSEPPRKTLKDGRIVEKHPDGLWYPVEG